MNSVFVLGLGETDGGLVALPFATLLEQLDALEALEDGTFAADFGVILEAVVLGHGFGELRVSRALEGCRGAGN